MNISQIKILLFMLIEPICLYWNTIKNAWATDGCTTQASTTNISCLCTHLTNFTIGSQITKTPSPANTTKSLPDLALIVGVAVGCGVLLSIITIGAILYIRNSKKKIVSISWSVKIDFLRHRKGRW